MSESYKHIQEYEKEILEQRAQGKTRREICEKFGFSKKQYKNFITRYNRRQDKIAAGIVPKAKADRRRTALERKKIGFPIFAASWQGKR